MPPVTGSLIWLKADADTYQDTGFTTPATSNNDPVGGWKDQSGNAHHFTQATSGNRPTFKTNITQGLPGILQNGSVLLAATSSINLSGVTGMTVMIAFQLASANNGNSVYSMENGAHGDFNDQSNYIACYENGTTKLSAFTNSQAAVDVNRPADGTVILWGFTIGSAMDEYIGDRSGHSGPTALSPAYAGSTGQNIGLSRMLGGGTLASNAYIFEVLVYTSILSSADLDTNFAYLTRWTTPAAGSHPWWQYSGSMMGALQGRQ